MEPEARYTLVGAVLVALAAAAVLTTIWLARSGAGTDFDHYIIHFEHRSLEGLRVGADVNMRGVAVGRVEDVAIARDNINRVDVTVRVRRDVPVSDNTEATLGRNLLTGLARIELVTPGTPGPVLTEAAPGEPYPVIPESTDRSGLTSAVDRLAQSGTRALDSLDQLLSEDNRKAFAATLDNLRDLSGALSQRVGKLDTVVAALVRSSNEFGKSSREIAAAVERVSASAQPVASQAEVTLRDLSQAVHALEREAAALTAKLDGAADRSVLEIHATAQRLRETAEILARAADRFKDPRALILGPSQAQLGPGEKLP